MAFAILGTPKPAFFDSSGAPLAGGTLSVLDPADDTDKASYPSYDDAEASPPTNPNANPITLDARGECDLWGIDGEDYKLVLKDANGDTIWTTDDVFLPVGFSEWTTQTAAEVSAGVTPTDYFYSEGDVRRYGAVGDGVTDDTVAIQSAIDVAGVSGGTVYLPEGTFLLSTSYTANGTTYHLTIVKDYITVKGEGRGTQLKTTTSNAAVFLILGSGKPAGVANWGSYQARDEDDTTVYTISGTYSKGGMSVTCATAAQAANFSAGDLCIVRSGQTVAGTDQPDGEVNEVLTVDSGTGVIELVRPLAKDYAQENYNSGSSGQSSVGGAGTACAYGIANVNDRMLRGIKISDISIDSTAGRHALVGGQIDGFVVQRVYAEITNQGFASMGCYRDVWYQDNILHTRGTGTTTWHLSVDSCCVDVWFKDNVLTSERVNYVHVHEGAARTHVINNKVLNTPSTSDENGISIRSRAIDTIVDGNHVVNAGSSAAIYVDSSCDGGGIIKNNIVEGTKFTEAVSISSPNWFVQHASIGAGNVSYFGKATSGYVYGPAECLSTWVYDDAQNQPLGQLPAYSFISKVMVHLTEVFDSDGTDELTVGWDANTDGVLEAIDVSSAAGTGLREFTGAKDTTLEDYTPTNVSTDRAFDADTVAVDELADVVGTLIADRQAQQYKDLRGYNSTARDLEVYYTAGGSAPTTGQALVVVEYYRVQRQV